MKIICIGRNYADHAKELNNPVPTKPLVFMKPSSALLKEGRDFFYPTFSENIHYECEVVLKIKKNGRHIQPKFARQFYDEVSLGLDMTARDVQSKCKEKGHPWEIAKAFDFSAPIGSFCPIDEVQTEEGIEFILKKNGETVQHGHTKDLIFDFDYLISYVSQFFTLSKGDLIYTGTPAGVGPIAIGDEFEGYFGDKKVLHCTIK